MNHSLCVWQLCRDLVDAVNGAFLQFDFRNGPLRRRYDGIKYTLKKLETTLVIETDRE